MSLTGSFYTHGGSYPDTLVGLDFEFTSTDGSPCTDCSWALSGTDLATASPTTATVSIPAGRQLVSWEQSLSSDSAVLMGITLTLDDGSTLELGVIGPVKDAAQNLGGPIHGVRWTFSEVITSVQLGYNSCYCDMTVTAPPATVALGV